MFSLVFWFSHISCSSTCHADFIHFPFKKTSLLSSSPDSPIPLQFKPVQGRHGSPLGSSCQSHPLATVSRRWRQVRQLNVTLGDHNPVRLWILSDNVWRRPCRQATSLLSLHSEPAGAWRSWRGDLCVTRLKLLQHLQTRGVNYYYNSVVAERRYLPAQTVIVLIYLVIIILFFLSSKVEM